MVIKKSIYKKVFIEGKIPQINLKRVIILPTNFWEIIAIHGALILEL